MKHMLVRMPVALMVVALASAPLFAAGQAQPPATPDTPSSDAASPAPLSPKDAKKAEDDKKKAEKKAAEQAKKAAEDAKKAEEKTAKEDALARKSAAKHKNNDIENIGNRDINKGSLNLSSIENEIAVGKQAAADVEKQVQLIQDPMITEYVNRVGQNLVANSDAKVPFTIKVIDSDEINAFALPGGFFYVNTGVILAADDEAELAGVMAHEIAHVAARHAMENESKAKVFNIVTIPLIIFGGPIGMVLRQATSIALPLQFIQFTKKAEAEADYLGVQYLDKTGYDPSASVSFFEKLQAKEQAKPGTMNAMFASHPPTEERIRATKAEIETVLPAREKYVVTTSEFQRVKNHLIALQGNPAQQQPDEKRPSLIRRRPNGRPDDSGDDGGRDSGAQGRPDDRSPDPDSPPVLQRRN